MNPKLLTSGGLAAFATLIVATAVLAQSDERLVDEERASHVAELTGGNEVPPLDVPGTGNAYIFYDAQTNRIEWTVTYTDLTGELTGAHIHGPAGADENADVLIDLRGGEESEGVLEGEAEITQEQADQLIEGLWYVNLHTEANPGGEIRGQLMAVEEDAAAAGGDVEAAPAEPAEPTEEEVAALMDEGEDVFDRNCAACHGAEGGGGDGPALAGNARLASASSIVTQIVFGGAYMPAFGHLTDAEVAGVGTYIRNSWGNEFGPLTEARVTAIRAAFE